MAPLELACGTARARVWCRWGSRVLALTHARNCYIALNLYRMHAGVTMCSPDVMTSFKCHARLLCGTSPVLNMMQFNSQYGCAHCAQSGNQLSTGGRGRYMYILKFLAILLVLNIMVKVWKGHPRSYRQR